MMADDRTAAGGCRCDDCAIRRTFARYNIAGDRGDLAGLAATFTEDGVLRAPGIHVTGRAAIVTRLEASMAGHNPALTSVQHNLTTSLIETDGEGGARCRSYFVVFTDIGPDHAGSYHDRLVCQDGEWLIAERSARVSWVSPASLFTIASDEPAG
jgi:uncharacterized protein (TIGR02246 family)